MLCSNTNAAVTVQWYLKEEQPFASATWQMMLGAASSIMALFGVSPLIHIRPVACGQCLTCSMPSTMCPPHPGFEAGNG
jgi:hypothetical protein